MNIKAKAAEVWAGVRAGLTTPDAVKAEKALGAIVVVRILIALGASAELVQLATKLIG